MTAATQGRQTPRRDAIDLALLVNTGTTIYAGTQVSLLTATGKAVPSGTAGSGPAIAVAQETVTGDGAATVRAKRGLAWRFDNSAGGDAISIVDIANTAYIAERSTVAKTDNSGARKAAGKIIDVDAAGVWVLVG